MKKTALSMVLAATVALAQTPGPDKRAEFEVASIHVATDDGHHGSDSDKGFLTTHNLTLKRLIAMAWDVNIGQIYGGPGWVDSDSYDIRAKIPAEFAQQSREKVPLMIQSLLAERFQLAIHREPREVNGYALMVAKKGLKLERANADQEGSSSNSNNTHLKAENVTMEAFAKDLSRNRDVGKLVADKTGLAGGFNFTLDWMADRPEARLDASPDDRPLIFTAIQEQLGLQLESARVPVLAIVIDRAEKPAGN
jgi:uncharacterized protein (TIGR03435 family)